MVLLKMRKVVVDAGNKEGYFWFFDDVELPWKYTKVSVILCEGDENKYKIFGAFILKFLAPDVAASQPTL